MLENNQQEQTQILLSPDNIQPNVPVESIPVIEPEQESLKEKTKRKPRIPKKESVKETETNEINEQLKNLLDELQPEKLIEDITDNCMQNLKDFHERTTEQLKTELNIINEKNQKINFMKAMAEVHKNIPKIIPNRHVRKKDSSQEEYTYADLTTTVENTRNVLSAQGLYVEFRHKLSKQGTLKIKCLVHHKDGYTYEGETMKIPVNINDVQAITSTITYMKRYLYNSMFNLTTEYDDDGNKAAKKSTIITPKEKINNTDNKKTIPQKQENQQNHPQQFNPNNNSAPKQIIPDTHQEKETKFQCCECNATISEDEYKFSTFAFGKPYCMPCQQNHK